MTEFEYEDRLTITTPEGVDLVLTLAGVASRFIAAAVDVAIETIVLVALFVLVSQTDGFGAGANVANALYVVTLFLVFWGYNVAFEVLGSGRTPGKRWNGLRVVRSGGRPVGFLASAARNIMRIIDFLPALYTVGVIAILVTPKNQRLGDVVAGTVVLRERRAGVVSPVDFSQTYPRSSVGPTDTWDVSAITAEELAAVRSFLVRREDIEWSARVELGATIAARLRPKVAGVPDDLQSEAFLEQLAAAKAARG